MFISILDNIIMIKYLDYFETHYCIILSMWNVHEQWMYVFVFDNISEYHLLHKLYPLSIPVAESSWLAHFSLVEKFHYLIISDKSGASSPEESRIISQEARGMRM